MFRLTQNIVDLAEADELAPVAPPVPDRLRDAVVELVDLLPGLGRRSGCPLFADNVELDDRLGRRRTKADRLVRRCEKSGAPHRGGPSERRVQCRGGICEGERGRARVSVQLAPTVPALVQRYVIRALPD
ncbi:MAG: hypothetical protein R2705_14865 [Ilumatobacteraceae bacterium]